MNASSALLFVVLLSSCISPLADSADGGDLPDAPADISVNSQYVYVPDISNEKHPMHI